MTDASELALYRALLDVTEIDAPGPFLERTLALVVAATGANVGYLGLGTHPDGTEPTWYASHGLAPEPSPISRSMLARALAGDLLHVARALEDVRFRDSESVRRHAIDTVICAPIGDRGHVTGVLYLQGRDVPFTDEDAGLVRTVARHIAPHARRIVRHALWEEPDPTAPFRKSLVVETIAGRSRALASLFRQLRLHAARDTRVVLLGPRGIGKTTLARALHDSSPRRDGPFVKVDCSRLHGPSLAADLFGARRGAWTGLDRDLPGSLDLAQRGTLFLDEVGALAAPEQQMLLTFLDDQVYTPVRDTRQRTADVRIVAATNEDVDARIADRTYRADFWDRLGHRVVVPPLADRIEDMPLLVDALLRRLAHRLRIPPRPLSPAAMAWCEQQPWPGNIRELESRLESALLWAADDDASYVAVRHLVEGAEPGAPPPERDDDLRAAEWRFRRAHVAGVLQRHPQRGKAALALGISRSRLYELLRELDLEDDPRR